MRNIISPLLIATLLAGFSTVASAATEVRSSEGHQSVGSVSITGASNVDDAVNALAKKPMRRVRPISKPSLWVEKTNSTPPLNYSNNPCGEHD